MGIAGRVGAWWRARKGARDDNPEALRDEMDQAYRSQTALLAQVRRGVADVATSRKRVEVQLAGLRRQIDSLDGESRDAVTRGDDAAARDALTRKVTLEKAAAELSGRHDQLAAEERKLTDSASAVERRIEDFRIRKDTLTARYSAATARAEISSATTGIESETSRIGQAMSDAERHTRELEATADAVDELVSDGIISRPGESADDALARKFDQLLAEPAQVDAGQAEPAQVESGTGAHNRSGEDDGTHQISQ